MVFLYLIKISISWIDVQYHTVLEAKQFWEIELEDFSQTKVIFSAHYVAEASQKSECVLIVQLGADGVVYSETVC